MSTFSIRILALTFLYLSILSCQERTAKTFVQPHKLAEKSGFNFAQLSFNENADELISEVLDTTDTGFTGKNEEVLAFGHKIDWKNPTVDRRFFQFPEKRYVFKSRQADSIAQFDGVYFDRVTIETDPHKKITAILGRTKFEHKKDLDSLLVKIFKKYGKTTDMQEYDRHNAEVEAEFTKNMNQEQKEMSRQSNPVMDYKGYLLDYGDNDGYREWTLKDRILQVSFTKDREISVNSNPEKNYNIEYFYIDFLILQKSEYEKIGELQLEKAKETKQGLTPYKVYEIKAFDPVNPDRYKALEKAWSK